MKILMHKAYEEQQNEGTLIIVLDFNKIIAELQPELLSDEEMAAIMNS